MRYWRWLLARVSAVAVLLGLALWYRMPASGEREFRRTIEALQKVNSIHYSMLSDSKTQHTEREGEMLCSTGDRRLATRVVLHQDNKEFNIDNEVRVVDGQEYSLQASGLWQKGGSQAQAAQDGCKVLIESAYPSYLPEFQRMVEHGIIEKGEKKTVNGEECREWRVTLRTGPGPVMPQSPGAYEHRTICLGVEDHLPREMTSTANTEQWTYAFNVPVKIETPTALVPERVWDNYQPPPAGLTLSNDNDDNN